MVNILALDSENYCEKDEWGVMMPPRRIEGYLGEKPSPVFRYRNGKITIVPTEKGHRWHRNNWQTEGGIISQLEQVGYSDIYRPAYFTPYQTVTVFRGWKFRPVVFMERDATVHDVNRKNLETCESSPPGQGTPC